MARGGVRPGAGRPSNAEREARRTAPARALTAFNERVLQDLPKLYDAALDLATGIYYEGCAACEKEREKCRCREGCQSVRIYRRTPDPKSVAELIAHAKGRAATAEVLQPDTQITIVNPHVPRPPVKTKEGPVE